MNYRIDNSPGIGKEIAVVCTLLIVLAVFLIWIILAVFDPRVHPMIWTVKLTAWTMSG